MIKEKFKLYNYCVRNIAPITLIYCVILLCSIALLGIYKALLKENVNKKGYIVILSIIVTNLGYFLLSFSKTLSLAIFANRLSYTGSVTLLVVMYLIVNEFCNVQKNKMMNYAIMIMSLLALLLSLTGGTSIKIFYESVSISRTNNVTHLIKTYGPMHMLYGYYVFMMFIIMLVTAVRAIIKKKVISSINPVILLMLVTENMVVWYIEKLLSMEMELLSISYVTTGIIYILLFKSNNDYIKLNNTTNNEIKTADQVIEIWKEEYKLTNRELDIVKCLISNTPRSKIAEELFISEHTVKKHTTHIYEKLHITSRNDLLHKLNEDIMR